MDSPLVASLSLFSGIGGLDLGVQIACPRIRSAGFVEWEAYAAACLLARMENEELEPAPIFCGDVSRLEFAPFVGTVDLVVGGFPCQDVSVAGKGAGIDGERSGLWREMRRAVCEIRPRVVFVENVAALAIRGLDRVLADMAELGFDAEWDVFRASDVGAPHRRARLFILATRRDVGSQRVSDAERDARRNESERGIGSAQPADAGNAEPRDVGGNLGDAARNRLEGKQSPRTAPRLARGDRGDVADADLRGCVRGGIKKRAEHESTPRRVAFGRRAYGGFLWPPGPQDRAGWERWIADGGPPPALENPARFPSRERTGRKRILEAGSSEHGWDAGKVESGIRRGAHGLSGRLDTNPLTNRADRLRCLGNAVVPDQAALAWNVLTERTGVPWVREFGK